MRLFLLFSLVLMSTLPAYSQGVMDVLSGNLINPTVGDYAWYEIIDATTGKKLFLRQAVVGAEKVKKKEAVWVETEIRPEVGFPTIYKMLLSGSASDPENVHRMIVQEAPNPPEEVKVEKDAEKVEEPEEERQLVGTETIPTADGTIEAQHYTVKRGGETIDLWLNETVRPLGVVQLKSTDGEMKLQRFGNGGEDAQSVLDKSEKAAEPNTGVKVKTEVSGGPGPTTNFSGKKKE